MRNYLLIALIFLLSACGHIEPVANPASDKARAADKMKDSTLPELINYLAFGEGVEKQEAAYRIGSLAITRNNGIVQSRITGEACPDKSDFAPAIAPLAAALRSKEDGLQYEAASTLLAIGSIDENAFDALSHIGASTDPDIVRAKNQHINYLFIPPCNTTTAAPGESPAPVAPPKPSNFKYVELWLDKDYTVNRSDVGDLQSPTWVIVHNGQVVLERNAKNETQYQHTATPSGTYTIYVTAFIDGAYRVVSNVVHFHAE